jgi:hypothetical protein
LKRYYLLGHLLLLLMIFGTVQAQTSQPRPSEAPRILTPDLLKRQKVAQQSIIVDFVIVGRHDIVIVYINDEPQAAEIGKIVAINKRFNLKVGRNRITVSAEDLNGNKTTENYIVAYGAGVEIQPEQTEAEPEKKKKSRLNWNVSLGLKQDIDSNPSDDLGVPIDTGDIVVEGIVPDEDQPDTRITKSATVSISYSLFSAFVGANTTSYAQERYATYNTELTFLGMGYTPKPTERGIVANYMFADINNDGYDTLQSQTFTLGYQFGYIAKNESNSKQTLALVMANSDYADETVETSSTGTARWEYFNLDKERLDSFRYVLAYGSQMEGDIEQENTFLTMDFQWKNKWQTGILFDIGFGFGHKKYPNQSPLSAETPLGDTRTDIPISYNHALGFTKWGWRIKYNFDYSFNLSNLKPTVRQISGVELSGSF